MNELLTRWGLEGIERGWLPDALARYGSRRLSRKRLSSLESQGSPSTQLQSFVKWARQRPLAVATDEANEQHYEVPAEFYHVVLGPRLKYSCCYWDEACDSLADAEDTSLRLTCQRAELEDGQDILELGCGWGSLTLWMAERFPNSRITAVSNSHGQRKWIEAQLQAHGWQDRVRILTCDMNAFQSEQTFDRVVSVEMFEHMQNHELLLSRIAGWLRPDGKLFVHIFCHKNIPYTFEDAGAGDWMAKYFFTGGVMPSEDLFNQYQRDLTVTRQWRWDGRQYQQTCEAWLERLDKNRSQVLEIFTRAYGAAEAKRWLNRWRLFFLGSGECFALNQGQSWGVCHYLFQHSDET